MQWKKKWYISNELCLVHKVQGSRYKCSLAVPFTLKGTQFTILMKCVYSFHRFIFACNCKKRFAFVNICIFIVGWYKEVFKVLFFSFLRNSVIFAASLKQKRLKNIFLDDIFATQKNKSGTRDRFRRKQANEWCRK